jgi:hypothetical protein
MSTFIVLIALVLVCGLFGHVTVAGHIMEEEMVDIEGEEMAGGIHDETLDAIERSGIGRQHNRPSGGDSSDETPQGSAEAPPTSTIPSTATSMGKTDEKTGLFCNDQKIEPSFLELLVHMMPDMDMGETAGVVEKNAAKLKGALSKLVSSDGDGDGGDGNNAFNIQLPNLDPAHPLSKAVGKLQEAGKFSSASIGNFSRQEVPIMALVSNGVFTLKGVENPDSITMIQQNYASVNLVCNSKAAEYLGPLRGVICSCYGGDVVGSHFAGRGDGMSHESQWCKSRNLCENTRRGASCTIKVDPFRTTCISYVPGLSFESVDYAREVPVVDLSGSDMGNLFTSLGKLIEKTFPKQAGKIGLAKGLGAVGNLLDRIFACIPSYLANTIGGIVLMSQADELSSSVLFQYVLAATFGALLAVVWILLALYRTTETMMKNSAPMFAPGLGAVFIFSSSWILNQSSIRNMIASSAVEFWETGAPTPFPWAGKAYFCTSMGLSIFLTAYFGLFSRKSNSRYVLKSLVKIISLVMLSQSTSNFEVSCLVVVYGLTQEQLHHWSYRVWLSYTASTQKASSKLMGRALYTKKELEDVSRVTTERELAKLRAHLLNSPVKAEQFGNKLRQGGKTDEANLLNRFLAGAYHLAATPLVPGTPGYGDADDPDADEGMVDSDSEEELSINGGSPFRSPQRSPQKKSATPKRSLLVSLLRGISMSIIAMGVIVVGVVFVQRYSKSPTLESAFEKLNLIRAITMDVISNARNNYRLS